MAPERGIRSERLAAPWTPRACRTARVHEHAKRPRRCGSCPARHCGPRSRDGVVRGTHGREAGLRRCAPGRGTRNALASLGGRQYLEIIPPDPAQKAFSFQLDLRKLQAPRIVNWAVASDDVDIPTAIAAKAKYAVYGPQEGSRMRPDGAMLQWRTVGVLAPFRDAEVDPMPFFIQWGSGVKHPSEDSPAGCRLAAFELRHPEAAALRALLAVFDIDAVVAQADRPGLTATLDTPRGKVML